MYRIQFYFFILLSYIIFLIVDFQKPYNDFVIFVKKRTFTVESMDTHHKMNPVLKLRVVFFGGEVWMLGGEKRLITIETASKHQLPQKSFFCFIEATKEQFHT